MDREQALKTFGKSRVGRNGYKPLKHKNGKIFTDLDYFELLGRKCLQMDNENPNKNLPTDYGKLDRDCVKVAKEVVRGLDNGMSRREVERYIQMCIQLPEDM